MADKAKQLKHIAFIMDGNGRWAKKRLMPREYGHKVGAETFRKIVEYCRELEVEAVTVYAFSTENWKRPEKEVKAIMSLFNQYLDFAIKEMMEKDIRIIFLGNKSVFPPELRERMEKTENDSKNNKYILNIGINYGGRDEIVNAVNECIKDGITTITEDDISARLYTKVLSNDGTVLLERKTEHWNKSFDKLIETCHELEDENHSDSYIHGAYSELYFTDILWPDLSPKDVDDAVNAFKNRNRRYGGV